MDHSMKDASLKVTTALPNGAATVNGTAIDLGTSARANNLGLELLISAPALVVGDLPNGETMKYKLQMDADVAFGSAVNVAGVELIVQTGAGGAGAAAATKRVALPSDCERYVRLVATNSGAGDASDKSATLEYVGSSLC